MILNCCVSSKYFLRCLFDCPNIWEEVVGTFPPSCASDSTCMHTEVWRRMGDSDVTLRSHEVVGHLGYWGWKNTTFLYHINVLDAFLLQVNSMVMSFYIISCAWFFYIISYIGVYASFFLVVSWICKVCVPWFNTAMIVFPKWSTNKKSLRLFDFWILHTYRYPPWN